MEGIITGRDRGKKGKKEKEKNESVGNIEELWKRKRE